MTAFKYIFLFTLGTTLLFNCSDSGSNPKDTKQHSIGFITPVDSAQVVEGDTVNIVPEIKSSSKVSHIHLLVNNVITQSSSSSPYAFNFLTQGKKGTQVLKLILVTEDNKEERSDDLFLFVGTKPANSPPVIKVSLNNAVAPTSGSFQFDASATYDNEDPQDSLKFTWYLNGSPNTASSRFLKSNYIFTGKGINSIKLVVTDSKGASSEYKQSILVTDLPMVHLPAGSFLMGDRTGEGYFRESPVHTVKLDAFFMAQIEVTNQLAAELFEWGFDNNYLIMDDKKIYFNRSKRGAPQIGFAVYLSVDSNGSDLLFKKNGNSYRVTTKTGTERIAIDWLSWRTAALLCNFLSLKEGFQPVYNTEDFSIIDGNLGFRLPFEAEWEYAARGGIYSFSHLYSGGNDISRVAHYFGNATSRNPVGTKFANFIRIYDLTGNVSEFCYDYFDQDYYQYSPVENPQGPSKGDSRVFRGGSFLSGARTSRVAYRLDTGEENFGKGLGFRMAFSAQKE